MVKIGDSVAESKPKLLLINYTDKDADAVRKATNTEVFRGYISNGGTVAVDYQGNEDPSYDYFFPVPPYECSMVFVNMDNYADAKAEFKEKQQSWTGRETKNLHSYWKRNDTLVVFFVGDTKVGVMHKFAVPVTLISSSGVDTEVNVTLDKKRVHRGLFDELSKQITMPTSHYIQAAKDDMLIALSTDAYLAIRNKNGDVLSVIFTKDRYDYDLDGVGLILLPKPKNLPQTTGTLYKHFDPNESNEEWENSDDFYPSSELNTLRKEIDDIITQAKTAVETRQTKIDEHRKKYAYLKDLVTAKDDILVDAVYNVLTEVLGLGVKKSDEVNAGNPKEDLLVTYQGKEILLEIKGTNRQNPSQKFTQQPVLHALRQGLKDASIGLVLNYDFNTRPDKRTLAYNDKETRPLIADIHFIDTRVLLEIAKNVIDGELTIEDATTVLFGEVGRATYPTK